ncbi:hypothetical protein LAZ67_18001125, partial [Cordylochernes scorpioides]
MGRKRASTSSKEEPLEERRNMNLPFELIPRYDPDEGLSYDNWSRLFDHQAQQQGLSSKESLSMMPMLFKGKALEMYALICRDISSLEELHSRMKRFFHEPEHGLHRKFWQVRKGREQSVKEYYFAKIKLATKLGLSQDLILEGLTSGIESEFERFLIAASPTSLERWLEIAEAIEISHCRTTSSASGMEMGYPARRRPSTSWQGGQGFRTRNWREGRNDRPGTHLPPTRSQTASLAAVQDHEDNHAEIFGENKFNIKPLNIQPPRLRLSDKKPVCVRPYRHSLRDRDLIKRQIEQLLKYGLIKPASSPYSAPVTLAPKKGEGRVRLCIDYRLLNMKIISDSFPIPLMEDIVQKVQGARVFSCLDILSAYWTIPLHPKDREMTCFSTSEGSYVWCRLPFGLKTAPAIFNRKLSAILQKYKLDNVTSYFDDILVFSENEESHLKHLGQIFEILRKEGIQLRRDKCLLFMKRITYLGYEISENQISPSGVNVDVIKSLPPPRDLRCLRSFLGSVTHYAKFIKNFNNLRAPLNELLKKNSRFIWTEECQRSFEGLKEALCSKPILQLFNPSLATHIYCDASTSGIGAVLKQEYPDGTQKPFTYFSRALRGAESKYTITELELLAVVETCKRYHPYISGSHVIVHTDHKALIWLNSFKHTNGRLFRWSLKLSEYDLDFNYNKGCENHEADMLSRLPYSYFLSAQALKQNQGDLSIPPSKLYSIVDGITYIRLNNKDRVVVPPELQDDLIQKAHESLGHPGISAMIRALSVQYYFKGMIGKIKNYVKNCKECQTIKSSTQPSYGLMGSLPRAAKPFDVVALDTVLGLGGYNSAKNCVHTVIDHHSRYIWGYASKGTSIATYINIINQLLNIGKPRILVTDRHPSFVSKRFNKFLQEKCIKHVMTSPSHPECNGLVERANATLIGRLKIQHQGNPRAPWPKLLQKTLEEYRDTPHSTTTFPPIYLLYGTLPSYMSDLTNPYPPVERARTIANEKTEELHKRLVKRYNSSHRFPNLKIGDKVLYRIPHQVGHGKLSPVYYPDPYTVLSTPSPHTVEINKPCQPENKPSTIVNVSKLKLWDPISTSNEGRRNYPFPFQDVEDLNGYVRKHLRMFSHVTQRSVTLPARIQPPETFDFSTPNEWPKWRKRFERYLVVSGMKKKEEADKIDLFMYLMGDRADDIFRTFKFEKEEEATKIDSVLKAFDSHFCVRKNIIYERAKFNSRIQEDREPVDEFITSLYKLADSCEFEGLHEQLIRDRIVVGVRDKALSERMQLDSELTLEKAVKMVRQQEAVRQQQVDLQRPSTSQKVNQVKFNSKKQSPKQQQQPSRKKEKSAKTRSRCPKCGGFTHREGQACRAEGQKCNLCSKTGHFANCCPDKQAKTAEVKAVSELDEEIGFLLEVSAVEDSSNLDDDEGECRRRWTAEIQVNGKQVKFKLDSQADVTCVPLCLFRKIMGQQRLVESDINIRAAEFSELQTVGMFISTLRNGNYEIKEKIYVIRRLSEPLLSRRACELLNLARRIEVVATRINPIKDEMLTKIFEAQQEDTTLEAVVNYLEQGWPDKKKMSQALLSYWHVKDELGVQNGLLMRSCRLVIPASMKLEILDKLHAGHFGITKTRLRARETVWWPGISEEIAETVRKCSVCIQEAVSKHEPLIPTNFPTRPWQKIGMDLFKFENKWYLVVIDYYSRYPEMVQLDRLTASVVVRSCKSIFARHGVPETVVSDNGTQFGAAREFANFARQYGFTHVTSSPRFPQSNGMAEAGVKIAKLILKKNQDPSLGLLEYRSTPLENGYSPAELLMGRKLRTTLPIAPENLNPKLVDSQALKRKEGRRRKDMKSRYDRRCGATDMEELSEGDTVWITDMRTWGIVKKKASTPRSYMVDTPVGTLRRNRFHLRKGYAVQYPADPSTPTFSGEELVENEKTPVVDYPSNDSEDGQIRTRSGRIVKPSRQDSGRQGTSKQVDHCLYRKMEQGREENPKEPMESDPDSESGGSPTFPKKETTFGKTQEIVPGQEDVTPPPLVSDVLGRLTTTLHQLSAVTGHRERWNRYDGSYEAQSYFTNYDAQADRYQLQYSTRLRKPPNLLQAPLRVTNTRARLTYHLDTRNLLPEEQYGFRKGHGTIDQLLFFTQKVKDAQNRKPTNHTIAAFLDLTQAFDKVWKNKLITKLYKHFKIDGKAITWINDFLKNRYIRVKYNGTLSKTFKLYQGLPQGSVLSPTLFTLFIAGIEEKISHKTNIGLFADDIILWSSNTNWKKAERDLNKTLFHLEKFANKHKLEFNPQKSETCLFTTDKKLYKIRPKIILKEQQLQYNKHPKYLGYTLDPEINSSKHIEEVIRKGRDRLKILKYISGREWGADATTLKLTYTSLIRPILEYGYQIYGTASETNLKSLERIQLSAARIITGLRNTCPNDIVLYEADIMPLKDRRSYNLPKYINKIKSYGNKHRTSKYILNWESNLRLKKEGPLHLAKRNEFLKYKVEKNYLAEKISPCKPLQNVIFNATLNEPTNKQYQNPEYLKQLSLEIINNIPKNAITIYTDGSRDELGHTGSGCLIKTTNGIEKMNRRNPDFCSVFRSELIAIYEALKSIRNTNYQDIWILTDSRSAIQHLSHTGELRDKVSRNIIGYLQKLSKTSKIHLQWIPSHVGIEGNEAADVLAKKGAKEPLPQKNKLTFKEIETIAKTKINKNWRIPPKHSWYSGVNPGGALNIRNRQHQTTLTRFRTGHLKPLKIENNNKIYPTCPKCSL